MQKVCKKADDLMLEKNKRIKLKGKDLFDLNKKVHERDQYVCILCGGYVEEGIKFHHEPCGINKSDELDKAVTLCMQCHHDRHFKFVREYKSKIKAYLLKKK